MKTMILLLCCLATATASDTPPDALKRGADLPVKANVTRVEFAGLKSNETTAKYTVSIRVLFGGRWVTIPVQLSEKWRHSVTHQKVTNTGIQVQLPHMGADFNTFEHRVSQVPQVESEMWKHYSKYPPFITRTSEPFNQEQWHTRFSGGHDVYVKTITPGKVFAVLTDWVEKNRWVLERYEMTPHGHKDFTYKILYETSFRTSSNKALPYFRDEMNIPVEWTRYSEKSAVDYVMVEHGTFEFSAKAKNSEIHHFTKVVPKKLNRGMSYEPDGSDSSNSTPPPLADSDSSTTPPGWK